MSAADFTGQNGTEGARVDERGSHHKDNGGDNGGTGGGRKERMKGGLDKCDTGRERGRTHPADSERSAEVLSRCRDRGGVGGAKMEDGRDEKEAR